jgi:uncharacterized membrane protein YgdD (TMEM256/DUF423 family)
MDLDKTFKTNIIIAFIFIILGITFGAIGAHALEKVPGILPKHIESWKTGVLYQLIQGLGILLLIVLSQFWKLNKTKLAINIITVGTLLFSISIYILVLNQSWNIIAIKYAMIPITPLGGILMITGWCLFLAKLLKSKMT